MNARSIVIAAMAVLILIAGWVVRNCSADRNKMAQDGELKQVTVMLDWTPNVNHMGLFVANAEGFFADEGLAVKIVDPGEVYPAAAVLSGRVQFGIDYQEYLTLLSEEQHGLLSVAALLQSNTSGFAVRAGDGIKSIADLAGLRYGSFAAPFEEPTLRALFACYGTSVDEIEYIPAGNDLLAMLAQERADLVWIFYGTQGFQAEEIGIEIDYFPMRDYTDCIPDYYTPILITSTEYAQAEPETVRAFLLALSNAYRVIDEAPERAADLLADAAPELNRSELHRSVPWLVKYAHDQNGVWGVQQAEVWQEYAAWMYRQGLLERQPTHQQLSELFSNDYLPIGR